MEQSRNLVLLRSTDLLEAGQASILMVAVEAALVYHLASSGTSSPGSASARTSVGRNSLLVLTKFQLLSEEEGILSEGGQVASS